MAGEIAKNVEALSAGGPAWLCRHAGPSCFRASSPFRSVFLVGIVLVRRMRSSAECLFVASLTFDMFGIFWSVKGEEKMESGEMFVFSALAFDHTGA